MKGLGKAKKVMMIGIDGFDPIYAKPLLDAGKLPNMKRFLEMGVTTPLMSMQGAMPTYTPPNWCSMATGAWPGTHGITCFWNHTLGDPLDKLSTGFDSQKCEAEYMHDALANQGLNSIVVGWPTTWPPTNERTILLDGSGIHPFITESADYEKFVICDETFDKVTFKAHIANDSGAECFVTEEVQEKKFGVTTTEHTQKVTGLSVDESILEGAADEIMAPIKAAEGWSFDTLDAKETIFLVNNGKERRYALIKAEDGIYNTVEVYVNKKAENPLGKVKLGEWSEMIYDEFTKDDGSKFGAAYRLRLLKMSNDGSSLYMYGSFATDVNSEDHVYPGAVRKELFKELGAPLMWSNCGRNDLEKNTIMYETMVLSCRWIMDAVDYLMENKEWSLVLQGLHIIDQGNHAHLTGIHLPGEEGEMNREFLEKYYILADEYISRAFKWIDKGVAVIIASDHGGLAVGDDSNELGDAWKLNIGVMQELGYTVLKEENGEQVIDWSKTTAIAQRSQYIYVNLKGRDPEGIVDPAEYEALVEKIIDDLYNYREPKTGRRIVGMALDREEMESINLYGPHVGDIFYTMTRDFAHDQGNTMPTVSRGETSIRCLFMAAGPGFKSNSIIDKKVEIVDLVPTLCYLLGVEPPQTVDGGVIYQILED